MNDPETGTSEPRENPSLPAITDGIVERLDRLSAARDRALTLSRQIVRLSANAVRALHRTDRDAAAALLGDARALLDQMIEITTPFPSLYWAGYVQDAMKELAEAAISAAMLADLPVPDPGTLGVEDAPYLNALAEAASELRRDTLDALREDDVERARALMGRMDDVYTMLVTVDF
ncbi:MAG: haloacid dehalogenase, partial [Chloroflexia bacterium]|nr:haloacid dehalogenase [Chloroflexia bacterium]